MVKDTFYFSHDFNARQDPKIRRLIMKHGMIGYGLFWSIVEDLYNNANALPTDYESIAFDLRVDISTIESIVKDFDLFVIDGDTFGSMSIQSRLDKRAEKSQKARESAQKRWSKDANAMRTQYDSNAIKERKGKEKKEKESNIPAFEIFKTYAVEKAKEKKLNIDHVKLSLKYESWKVNGWVNGNGKRIKNWKSTLLNTLPYMTTAQEKSTSKFIPNL